MPYTNITQSTVIPLQSFVQKNFVLSKDAGCFEKHVSARAAYLLLIPTSFITATLDTIIGIGLGAGACLTGGLIKRLNTYSVRHIAASSVLLANPYYHLMRAINPKLRFGRSLSIANFVSNLVEKPVTVAMSNCLDSKSFFMRHVVTRTLIASNAIACLVTLVADAIICLPVAALSLVTFGYFDKVNRLAFGTLMCPKIIAVFVYSSINLVNPYAKFESNEPK